MCRTDWTKKPGNYKGRLWQFWTPGNSERYHTPCNLNHNSVLPTQNGLVQMIRGWRGFPKLKCRPHFDLFLVMMEACSAREYRWFCLRSFVTSFPVPLARESRNVCTGSNGSRLLSFKLLLFYYASFLFCNKRQNLFEIFDQTFFSDQIFLF